MFTFSWDPLSSSYLPGLNLLDYFIVSYSLGHSFSPSDYIHGYLFSILLGLLLNVDLLCLGCCCFLGIGGFGCWSSRELVGQNQLFLELLMISASCCCHETCFQISCISSWLAMTHWSSNALASVISQSYSQPDHHQ